MGKSGGSGNTPVVVGYDYYLSMHMVICLGPVDSISKITTTDDITIYSTKITDAAKRITLNDPNLYGGKLKEGGVTGDIIVLLNGAVNAVATTSATTPAIDTSKAPERWLGAGLGVSWESLSSENKILAWSNYKITPTGEVTSSLMTSSSDFYSAIKDVYSGKNQKGSAPATVQGYSGLGYTANNENNIFDASKLPAFKGVVSILWDNLHYQSNSSRPKGWKFRVIRIPYKNKTNAVIPYSTNKVYNPNKTAAATTTTTAASSHTFSVKASTVGNPTYTLDGTSITPTLTDTGQIVKFITGNNIYYLATTYSSTMNIVVGGVLRTDGRFYKKVGTTWEPLGKSESDPIDAYIFNKEPYPVVTSNTTTKTPAITSGTETIDDANPAYVILECLTNKQWGLGYGDNPDDHIDLACFDYVAQTLKNEGFGVSCVWENSSTIEEFIGTILAVINAVLFVHPKTGKFTLKLLREDDIATSKFVTASPANIIEVRSFSRSGVSELVNQLTVQWTDAIMGTTKSMTVHNPAARSVQQHVVATTKQYFSVTSDKLAATLAMRDLALLSQSLVSVELIVNREASDVMLGDVFDFDWPDYGITGMSLRAVEIGYGNMEDNRITLKCIENIFKVGKTTYGVLQQAEFLHPSEEHVAVAPPDHYILSLPYIDLFRLKTNPKFATFVDIHEESSVAAILAASPGDNQVQYEVWGTGELENTVTKIAVGEFVPNALTLEPVTRFQTLITLAGSVGLDPIDVLNYALVARNAEGEEEFMQVIGVSPDRLHLEVKRGCIDTVPKHFEANTMLWFYGKNIENTTIAAEYPDMSSVSYKICTINRNTIHDGLQITAPALPSRWAKPYPPANIQITTDGTSLFDLSWSHRDAAARQDHILGDADLGVARVPGIYYAIKVLKTDGTPPPNPVNIVRYVGLLNGTTYETRRITHNELDDWLATPRLVVAVKSVQGLYHSEWNYKEFCPATGVMYDTYYKQEFFGTFEPIHTDIADELSVSVSGDFEYDRTQDRFEFEGDTLKLSFSTNIAELVLAKKMLYSQVQLDSWFRRYRIDFYNLNSVNSSGGYDILATKYTQESFYDYPLHENMGDQPSGTPSPTLGFNVYVEDTVGNISAKHSTVITKAKVPYSVTSPFTHITSSTGLSVKGNAPKQGVVAIFGSNSPATVMRSGIIPTQIDYYYIQTAQSNPITAYPISKVKYSGAAGDNTVIKDLTGLEFVDPLSLKIYRFDAITKLPIEIA